MSHIISVKGRGHIYVDGEPLGTHFSRHEEQLVRAILEHNACATKDFLLTYMYGGMDEPDIKIIDVFACKARAKLLHHKDAIQTMWGRGYSRHPEYSIEPEDQTVMVALNAKMMEEFLQIKGSSEFPSAIISKMIKAEIKAFYNQ